MKSHQVAEALIGHTGFVGTTLKKQHAFSHFYRSTDIDGLAGQHLDLAICCAAPAQKWIANQHPEDDWASIEKLINILRTIQARRFVLISTVDVFALPLAVDESVNVEMAGLHPYGLHRRRLEMAVAEHFDAHLILRLPGLVGPGLRKNVLFDFRNENDLHKIDHRSVFQFYPMVNLWADIQTALSTGLHLIHLTAAPCSVAEISTEIFGRSFENELDRDPACYDFRSLHAACFGGEGYYQYSRRESLLAMRAYAQSEPRS